MPIIAKLDSLLNRLNRHGEEYGFPFVLFSLFMILNYVLDIPSWFAYHQGQSNPFFSIQIVSFTLAIIFSLRKFWPQSLQKFYTLGWYGFVIWCNSFVETFYLVHYTELYPSLTTMLIINGFCILFTLILIVDWISFAVILVTGIILGIASQLIFFSTPTIAEDIITNTVTSYSWVIFAGLLFSHNASRYHKNLLLQRKLAAIRTVASMAHELRNPLATIRMSNSGIRKCFVVLMENYNLAQQAKLNGPTLHENQIEGLGKVFNNIDSEINFSNTMIDTLLANTKEMATQPTASSPNQISTCIQAAINRYAFVSDEQRKLVHLDLKQDFTYQGDDLMVTHVFFNLLKNAIQVITEQHKGEIFISLDSNEKYKIVRFKDTAKGMSPETQAKIFQSFYSETVTGTVVGLAFCTMIMKGLHGKIEVKSELGVFTEFVLNFPKM